MLDLKNFAIQLCVGFLTGLVALAQPAAADIYQIDRNQSSVGFSWTHLGISKQFGRFTDFDGTVSFVPDRPEDGAVDVTIRTGSIQTGVEALDRHLRSADFFDAANFRTIKFKSTAVIKTGEKTGEVFGDLTIRDKTQPVVLSVTWLYTGEHPLAKMNPAYSGRQLSAFSATGKIKRADFGLSRAANVVGDEIEIRIDTEMIARKAE